jgi:hypothetical protein
MQTKTAAQGEAKKEAQIKRRNAAAQRKADMVSIIPRWDSADARLKSRRFQGAMSSCHLFFDAMHA